MPCRGWRCGLVSAVLSLSTPSLQAADWTFTKALEFGLVHSDNVILSIDDPQADTIATLTPSFSLIGEGPRTVTTFQGSVQFLDYVEDSIENGDVISPDLFAGVETNLIREVLILRVDARATDSFQASALDSDLTLPSEETRNRTYLFNVAPQLNYEFTSALRLTTRYQHSRTVFELDDSQDSYRNSLAADIELEPTGDAYVLQLSSDYNRTDFADSSFFERTSVQGRVGVLLGLEWQAAAAYGQEWLPALESTNDPDMPVRVIEDVSQSFWNVALEWRPTDRTTIVGRYGERFFGRSPELLVEHTAPRSVTTLSWRRDLLESQNRPGSSRAGQAALTGDPIVDAVANAAQNTVVNSVAESLIVNERVALSHVLSGRVSTLAFVASANRREGVLLENDTLEYQVGASFQRRIGQDWSWRIGYDRIERERLEIEERAVENRVSLDLSVDL